MTRSERYDQFYPLRQQGMTMQQIADLLGVSRSLVSDVLDDPERSKVKQRRKRYGFPCLGCGKRTDGSNGSAVAPRFCSDCARKRQRPKHGTSSRYKRGCRCAACKRASAEHMRAWNFRTGRTAVKYSNSYRPHTGVCRGCGCGYDQRTDGCKHCYNRHYRRQHSA